MSARESGAAGAISRRSVLQGAMALGGLALCLRDSGCLVLAGEAPQYGAAAFPGGVVDNPLVFLSIHPDDTVTVTVHRPEMGQGIRTSLALVVADELEADWPRVRVTQAPADETRYGNQDTDGSRSMRHFFEPMRRVGAAARMMLEGAAAAHWQVPVSEVVAERHQVLHRGTGRRLSFGQLAEQATRQSIPESRQLRLKDPAHFRYIGKRARAPSTAPTSCRGARSTASTRAWTGCCLRSSHGPPCWAASSSATTPARPSRCPGWCRSCRSLAPAAGAIVSTRRCRGHGDQHLGGHPRPRGAAAAVGRRSNRSYDSRQYETRVGTGGAESGQGRAQ